MEFLEKLTQHIPEKNEHIVRFYGWYSHRRRGMRTKLDKVGQPVEQEDEQVSIDRSAIMDTETDQYWAFVGVGERLVS
jgi:hypothetical protein